MSDFLDQPIDPAAAWPDVPALSTEALLLGGALGPLNAQALALAARTKQLKARVEQAESDIDALQNSVGFVPDASVGEAQLVDGGVKEKKIDWNGTIMECRVVVTSSEFGVKTDNTGTQQGAMQAALTKAEQIIAAKGGCDVIIPGGRIRMTGGIKARRSNLNIIFQAGAVLAPVGNFDTLTFEHETAGTFIYKNHLVDAVFDETAKTGGRALVGRYLAESGLSLSAAAGFDGVLIESFNTVDLDARLTDFRSPSAIYALIRGGAGSLARSDVLRIAKLVMGGTYVAGQNGLVIDGFVHTVAGRSVYPVNIGGKGVWARNTVGAADVPTFLNFFDLQADYCTQAVRLDAGAASEFHSTIVHGSRQGDNIYVGSATKDVKFVGGRSTGASQSGIALAGIDSVVTGMTMHSNSSNQYTGTKGAYPGIIVGGTSRGARVFACRSGSSDAADFQSYGAQVDTGADKFIVSGNILTDNINAGVNNGAGTGAQKIITNNF